MKFVFVFLQLYQLIDATPINFNKHFLTEQTLFSFFFFFFPHPPPPLRLSLFLSFSSSRRLRRWFAILCTYNAHGEALSLTEKNNNYNNSVANTRA